MKKVYVSMRCPCRAERVRENESYREGQIKLSKNLILNKEPESHSSI